MALARLPDLPLMQKGLAAIQLVCRKVELAGDCVHLVPQEYKASNQALILVFSNGNSQLFACQMRMASVSMYWGEARGPTMMKLSR